MAAPWNLEKQRRQRRPQRGCDGWEQSRHLAGWRGLRAIALILFSNDLKGLIAKSGPAGQVRADIICPARYGARWCVFRRGGVQGQPRRFNAWAALRYKPASQTSSDIPAAIPARNASASQI